MCRLLRSGRIIPSTWEDPLSLWLENVTYADLLQEPSSTRTRFIVTNNDMTDVTQTDCFQREHVRLQQPTQLSTSETRGGLMTVIAQQNITNFGGGLASGTVGCIQQVARPG